MVPHYVATSTNQFPKSTIVEHATCFQPNTSTLASLAHIVTRVGTDGTLQFFVSTPYPLAVEVECCPTMIFLSPLVKKIKRAVLCWLRQRWGGRNHRKGKGEDVCVNREEECV